MGPGGTEEGRVKPQGSGRGIRQGFTEMRGDGARAGDSPRPLHYTTGRGSLDFSSPQFCRPKQGWEELAVLQPGTNRGIKVRQL